MRIAVIFLFAAALLSTAAAESVTYLVPSVYPTIQAAVHAVPPGPSKVRYRIKLAPGVYNESVKINKNRANITLLADQDITDPSRVTLRGGPGQVPLRVYGDDITIKNLTVEQTAAPADGPQQAVISSGTRVVFDNTVITANQDTFFLWGYRSLTYIKNSQISGTVDFIYGDGTAFFDHCTLIHRLNPKELDYHGITTAPSTPAEVAYGLVFSSCTITREAGVLDGTAQLYRAWRPYGEAVFINCTLDRHIDTVAWSGFDNEITDFTNADVTYRGYEYGSLTMDDPPELVDLSGRPAWLQRQFDPALFSKENVLAGWNP